MGDPTGRNRPTGRNQPDLATMADFVIQKRPRERRFSYFEKRQLYAENFMERAYGIASTVSVARIATRKKKACHGFNGKSYTRYE